MQALSKEQISNSTEIKREILEILDKFGRSKKLRGFEIIKDIHIVPVVNEIGLGFTIENNLLTPTYKLKRKEISHKYSKEIEELCGAEIKHVNNV